VTPTEFYTLQQQLYRLPACVGECGTALPLHVADGALVLDETYLTLPPEIDAARELAGARACVTRP